MPKQREKSTMIDMIRVFIFEDEWMCREALVAVLDKEAALEVVGTAADVAEGLTALPEAKPDVVLMDLRFGEKIKETKGLTATRSISEMLPEVKVIIFTSHPEDVLLTEAVQAGSSGFLEKKEVYDPAILVDAIHTVHKGEAYFTRTAATKAVRELRRLANALTDRELEVLTIMAEGATNHEIAGRLGIVEKTVAQHVSSVLSKLYAKNRTEAVALARRERLIT